MSKIEDIGMQKETRKKATHFANSNLRQLLAVELEVCHKIPFHPGHP